MKVNRTGQSSILNDSNIKALFSSFTNERDRCLFAICLYTGCRISEAVSLSLSDISPSHIVFRAENTKTKERRVIPVNVQLKKHIDLYVASLPVCSFRSKLFPGKRGVRECLSTQAADKILRAALSSAGLGHLGITTHSFRRTALTQLNNAGLSMKEIASISGHKDLNELARYLEVNEEQRVAAVSHLNWEM